MKSSFQRAALLLVAAGALAACVLAAAPPGKDLGLAYRSAIDGTDQPYRAYIPSAYDGARAWPLLLVLHGTGGTEDTLLDDERYGKWHMQLSAEKHGVLLASPRGRGTTEYRGIGENDLFCVLEEMTKRYRVDEDRVYIAGQSMGGTGAAYQTLHHPDVYAAALALAPAYSFPWLSANARLAPIWWIMGAQDSDFYHLGVNPGIERMRRLGAPVEYLNMAGEGHTGPLKKFDAGVEWLLRQRRRAHPREYEFTVDTPLHGRAWWTQVERMTAPGRLAVVKAAAPSAGRADFELTNVAELAFTPDPAVFRLDGPIEVRVGGRRVFRGPIPAGRQLRIEGSKARVEAARPWPRTGYRRHPVSQAPEALDAQTAEAPLAQWFADAIRDATGAELALYNRRHYRGLPISRGTVDMVDLIQASRPFDQFLVTVSLTGREIEAIVRANQGEEDRRVFVSGAAAGRLEPDRVYRVWLEEQVVDRETIRLAGKFKKIEHRVTETSFTMALYGYAARRGRVGR